MWWQYVRQPPKLTPVTERCLAALVATFGRSAEATGASNDSTSSCVPALAPTVIISDSNAGFDTPDMHLTDVLVVQDVVRHETSETAIEPV